MNAFDIKNELYIMFSNYNYKLHNTYIFGWESDFFAISKSGYSIEIEIKINYQDFKNDFKKTINYNNKKHDYILNKSNLCIPNKYCFACPEGLIKKEEIPAEYGLIYLNKNKITQCYYVKNPKFLHKDELLKEQWFCRKLLDKYYYRNMELFRLLEVRQREVAFNQRRLYDNYIF